jgi:uncharacterized protein with GYD domain
MARYALLIKFTEKGITHVKDSAKRGAAFREMASKAGVKVEGIYWLLGEYDGLAILNAPDESTAAAVALSVAALGNVHTCLCRAFDEAEFKEVLKKM